MNLVGLVSQEEVYEWTRLDSFAWSEREFFLLYIENLQSAPSDYLAKFDIMKRSMKRLQSSGVITQLF